MRNEFPSVYISKLWNWNKFNRVFWVDAIKNNLDSNQVFEKYFENINISRKFLKMCACFKTFRNKNDQKVKNFFFFFGICYEIQFPFYFLFFSRYFQFPGKDEPSLLETMEQRLLFKKTRGEKWK